MKVDIFNTDKKYNIIYADPPWEYKESGGGVRGSAGLDKRYKGVMSKQEIFDLPVAKICEEKSILFLWVTFPRLEQGIETIKAWGFEYYGLGFDWVKTTKNGSICWGMGYYTRQNTEVCLIGVKKDKKQRIKPLSRGVLSVLHSERREHSRKPDEVRDYIKQICGDLPRIELFARQAADGWDFWGNEAPDFADVC